MVLFQRNLPFRKRIVNTRRRAGWRVDMLIKVSPETPKHTDQLVSISPEGLVAFSRVFLDELVSSPLLYDKLFGQTLATVVLNFSKTQPGRMDVL